MTTALSEQDVDFVVETVAPDFQDKAKLKGLIRDDEAFRRGLIGDEKVFARLVGDENAMVRVSPALYFEVLLRGAQRELEKASHTVEQSGGAAIPVFDAKDVAILIKREAILRYLAQMLASFTRIESHTIAVRVKHGVWRKLRFSDLDVDSLIRVAAALDDEHRFGYLKRIADVCLFIAGMFPEFAHQQDPFTFGQGASNTPGVAGYTDYEEEGRRFYRLAAEHRLAEGIGIADVLWQLHANFRMARKPLSFVADHYLRIHKHQLFDVGGGQSG